MKITVRNQNTHQPADEGFTLIELLIVIVILGILAAVVVFSVAGVNDQGQKSACQSDVATVTTAGEAYLAQNTSHLPAATMDVLSTGGFLQGDSAKHDYTFTAASGSTPASYTITSKTGVDNKCTDVPDTP